MMKSYKIPFIFALFVLIFAMPVVYILFQFSPLTVNGPQIIHDRKVHKAERFLIDNFLRLADIRKDHQIFDVSIDQKSACLRIEFKVNSMDPTAQIPLNIILALENKPEIWAHYSDDKMVFYP